MPNWSELPANFEEFNNVLLANISRVAKLIKIFDDFSQAQLKYASKLTGKQLTKIKQGKYNSKVQ